MKKTYILIALLGFILSCGSSPSPQPFDKDPYLQMSLPHSWADNTPLIPERDLSFWKIYAMNLDNNAVSAWFTETHEVAQANVMNGGVLVTEFNLNLLRPFLDNGTYMIGVKVQSIDGQQSDFADNTVLWEKN